MALLAAFVLYLIVNRVERKHLYSPIAILVLADIPRNASLVLESWGRHFAIEPGASWALQGIAVLLLLLALNGWWRRAAGRWVDAY